MAGEFQPLSEILRELKPLVQTKSSGFFFVVTEDNHSCTIRIRNGEIDDVVFSRQRNDEAVRLLATVKAARARFQPIAVSAASAHGKLSDASIKWLLGDFENVPLATSQMAQAEPNISALSRAGAGSGQREVVEKIALNYFGPIASLLCDEAFVDGNDIGQALVQIASNLSSHNESRRFIDDANAAIAKQP
jgi:hypothetical protein